MSLKLDKIEDALKAFAQGALLVVVDDENRENEADLIQAAQLATAESIGFIVRYTSGVICVPMPGADLNRLNLPPMTLFNEDVKQTAFTVSVDASEGISTGISAADRAKTIHVLADPKSSSQDLRRPGHIFPLRAVEGGVLRRAGHTEAAVDLAEMSKLRPIGVLCELVHDDLF